MTGSRGAPIEPFRWSSAFFLGLVSYAASLAGLVFNTFVPVLLQAGHPLWHNTTGLHAPPRGLALAPSLAFFIMTWDNVINLFVHPWTRVRSYQIWTRWGRRKPWSLVGVPLAVAGLVVEVTGSQRSLLIVAAVALGIAWPLLQRVQVETVTP